MIKLSVIVCTFNRDKYILKTLRHLKIQKCKKELFEVLIIDNNSTDQTETLCRDFVTKNKLHNFYYYIELNQGHTFARNRGIRESNGQNLAFIDDDAYVTDTYCENIIDFFERNPEVSVIGGKITPLYENTEPKWMTKFLWPLVAALDMGNQIKPFKGAKYPIGANMAFRAELFKKYGNFNVDLGRRGYELEGGDEKEMIYRLRKEKCEIFYYPDMHVYHIIPDSRLSEEYIMGQAIGVGISEKKRLKNRPAIDWIYKILNESIKIAGTVILALRYLLTGKFEKGFMLIRFRFWVLKGYLKKTT